MTMKAKHILWGVGGVALASLGVALLRKPGGEKKPGAGTGKGWGGQTRKPVVPKRGRVVEPDWGDPFSPSFYRDVAAWVAPKEARLLRPEVAKSLANTLKKAYGGWFFDDDEDAVARVFTSQIKDKAQLSQTAEAFEVAEGRGLREFLEGFLSDGEMERLVDGPVARMKNYTAL